MKCPYCTKEVQDNTVVCQYCGGAIQPIMANEKTSETGEPGEIKIFSKDLGLGIHVLFFAPEKVYYPGDVVQATVEIYSEKRVKLNEIRANLDWHETYYLDEGIQASWVLDNSRYETNTKTLSSKVIIEKGEIPAGFGQVFKINFQIPADVTPTYTGEYSDVYLAVSLTGHPFGDDSINLVRASGPGTNKPPSTRKNQRILHYRVHKLIQGPDIKLVLPSPVLNADPVETLRSNKQFEARIRIPRLEWLEGEIIQGQLFVRSRDRYNNPQPVEIGLMWAEESRKSEHESFGVIKLAEKATFSLDKPTEFNFTLQVPITDRPSLKTDHTTVEWSINAKIGKLLSSAGCVQPIIVYTANSRERPTSQLGTAISIPVDTHVPQEGALTVQVAARSDENFAADGVIREQQKRDALLRLRGIFSDIRKTKEKARSWKLPLLLGAGVGITACCITIYPLVLLVESVNKTAEASPVPGLVGLVIMVGAWILTTYLSRRITKQKSERLISKGEAALVTAVDEITGLYPNWVNELGGKQTLLDELMVEKLLMNTGVKQL